MNEYKLEEAKKMLSKCIDVRRLKEQDLKRAMDALIEQEQKELIFKRLVQRLTPNHPYYKNDEYHCNYCHKKVLEGMLFCPFCNQTFTWSESVQPIISHLAEDDPVRQTDKIIEEIKKTYI